ncbi:hypothetical protein EWM64_g65 [Hericium alpestre]|uniref:NAD(P)-binding protein n=1 Tax=Hericium alpestre TaxID=135208 RepID=A0A4Z0AC80_9AGAM|nr:hypothetical protein EWM64_g65 [Hericium alpestre]
MPSIAITGANRGIGFEFVRQLSEKPDNTIIALVRNPDAAQSLRDLQRSNIHIVKADISDHATVKAAAAETAKISSGSLDLLINNAAWLPNERHALSLDKYPSDEILSEDLVEAFNVNVVGVVHTINAFLPLIKKSAIKKVVVISTGVGDTDLTLRTEYATSGPYCVSKAAVNMVVAKYAAECKPEGGPIFLALSPGLVNTQTAPPTPKQLEEFAAMVASFKKYNPNWERPLTPKESVDAMLAVIHNLKPEQSGSFLSHKGNQDWL